MDPPAGPETSPSFQVYLRLKPSTASTLTAPAGSLYPDLRASQRFLTVEETAQDSSRGRPTHIVITPPVDSRRRAVEKFAFTKVFQEEATQLDIFSGTEVASLVEGVLGVDGRDGRDGLLATLGVTGSGKSYTMLGSRSQRGLTQLALHVLFRSLGDHLLDPATNLSLIPTLSAADASEGRLCATSAFFDSLFRDTSVERMDSRAQTPMTVGSTTPLHPSSFGLYPSVLGLATGNSPRTKDQQVSPLRLLNNSRITRSVTKQNSSNLKDGGSSSYHYRRPYLPRVSTFPQLPDVTDTRVSFDREADYVVLVSMYEVYNDRIFDLLVPQGAHPAHANQKDRRRPLLFKSTEQSPDRKVVAGLRKIVCGSLQEALMVLEVGSTERRVAGTGSNSVSSRSHGFFCVEVKKRLRHSTSQWSKSTLTIVDLAGSERARNAKTTGATLAEAGKINESLMYLGQCLQISSDSHEGSHKNPIVPFRQCKLTELLFSNSFPTASHHHTSSHRNPQKAIMIVTADPLGDYNATSQILRYSALAREVTLPRIPSTSSTIFSGTTAKGQSTNGRTTPSTYSAEELALAAQELARMSEETALANMKLAEEQSRRREAEMAWKAAEERCLVIEQEVREECWDEMERRLEEERGRWKGAWDEEADRNDEHLDKKLDILTRSIQVHEDPEPPLAERIAALEEENDMLRRKLSNAERDLQGRSPTKKSTKKGTKVADSLAVEDSDVENAVPVVQTMILEEVFEYSKPKTPGKKQRKLTTRKWDLDFDVLGP